VVNQKFDDKKNKKIKKVEKPKNVPENKNDINLEKENKKFDDKTISEFFSVNDI